MKTLIAFACSFATALSAGAQEVKIERCEPPSIRTGTSTEIVLSGRGLESAALWCSFPAEIERLDEKAPRFRITTDFVGTGAIRAHNNRGVSDLFFLTSGTNGDQLVPSENRTRREDAQQIPFPAVVEGKSAALAASFYRFTATGGQAFVVHARSNGAGFDGVVTLRSANDGKRLAFADDSDVYGADPRIEFIPPADGEYIIELIDSQYRGGLPFRLRVGGSSPHPPKLDPQRRIHEESADDQPFSVSLPEMVYGKFEAKGDHDVFRFRVPAAAFLTITPEARSILSPAMPRMHLANAEGKILAETPIDAFDERPLRVRLSKGEDCRLTVEDAFGRYGSDYVYGLKLTTDLAPFELSIPRQADRNRPLQDHFIATQGGVFVIPVQCKRHQFDDAIALRVESEADCTAEQPAIGEKQVNLNLPVRLPENLQPGQLANLRVIGSATSSDKRYEEPLRTGEAIRERNPGIAIPADVDGQLAVRVIESPLVVEVSPPAEIAAGAAVTIPVTLVWRDEKQKFNTTLRIAGAPAGVQTPEKKLNAKDGTTGLELKLASNTGSEDLKNLRVSVTVDYHKDALLVESAPFAIRIMEKTDEKKD